MTDAERRKLVFANLLNGLEVEQVMVALKMSAKEVNDDFAFVAKKIRSYLFERGRPMVPCSTIAEARLNRAVLLFTASRLKLDKEPAISKIETLVFDPSPGVISDGERKLLEMRMRRGR